jgi:hypothetical protein
MSDTRSHNITGNNNDPAYRSQIHHSLTYSITTDSILDLDRKQIRSHTNVITVDRPDSSQVKQKKQKNINYFKNSTF